MLAILYRPQCIKSGIDLYVYTKWVYELSCEQNTSGPFY